MYLSFDELEHSLYMREGIRKKPSLTAMQKCYAILVQYLISHTITSPSYIHVLGTNGKGSISTYIASIAQEYQFSTLLFTSPHLVNIRERICINGAMLSETEWLEASTIIECVCDTQELLFFEYILLISIYFAHIFSVRIAVMEAGLGGEFDATRVLPYQVQVFTPIDYDHEHILGRTLPEIARQKGNAIQKESHIISAKQHKEVADVLNILSEGRVTYPDKEFTYPTSMQGDHQKENVTLAVMAWKTLCAKHSIPIQEELIEIGTYKACIKGRLQTIYLPNICPAILLDGAHNIAGMKTLQEYCSSLPICAVLYGAIYKESLAKIVSIVDTIAKDIPLYYHTVQNKRAVPYQEIIQYSTKAIEKTSGIRNTIEDINCTNSTGIILICGSLYLVGEFFREYPDVYIG